MKQSGTVVIFIIVWSVVLLTSFIIGICIREVRFHSARGVVAAKFEETPTPEETTTPKVVKKVEKLSDAEKLAQELSEKALSPRAGGSDRLANRSPRLGGESGMENIQERVASLLDESQGQKLEDFMNISEDEIAQKLEKLSNISEEEIAQIVEKIANISGGETGQMIREKFSNMQREGEDFKVLPKNKEAK